MKITRFLNHEDVEKLEKDTVEVNQQDLVFLRRQPYFQVLSNAHNLIYPYKVEIKITRVYTLPLFARVRLSIKLAFATFMREIKR